MAPNELSKMKMKRNILLVAVFLFLAGLIAYGIMRPDPEEQKIIELKTMMLSKRPGKLSKEERQNFRSMIEKLSPDTRKKLIREIMRGRLQQIREDTKNMTDKQKKEKVQQIVQKMRTRFSKMSGEQRGKIRERMNSPEGKKRMGEALDFFYKEFTPKERELFDPVVEEFTIQMER